MTSADTGSAATPAPASTALVATDRPARYGKQLASHVGRKRGGEWDADTGTGWIDLGDGRAELRATDDGLALAIRTADGDLDRLEDVIGRHLVRFGTADELHVHWARADGTPGTVQPKPEPEPAPIPDSHVGLLDAPNFAAFATVRPDGTPQVNPMWFLFEDGRIKLTHTTTRQKFRNLEANPNVALSISDPEQPYRYLEVRAVLESVQPDPDGDFFRVLARRYGQTAMDSRPADAADRVVLVLRPTATSLQ